ncbi:MAG: carbohydrate kinase family protein [Candidatus Harrisonbacteria bacterium]|nr:carbohydrate kinase family protein [Candidatus Harrisonbacteria bacterium]
MYDIVTIGSVTRDNFLESDYEIIKWPKTPSGRAICLPFGEKLPIKRLFLTTGGNSANASVTFARQGFQTACFGKIGDDLSGRELSQRLKKEGVQTTFSISENRPTAYSSLLLKGGERTILGYHGASDTWTLNDIPWRKLKSKWWYLSLAGESDKFLKPLLQFAKKNKIKVAFNPSGHHIGHKRKEVLSALKDSAFLVLNEGEAADLVGIPFKKEKEVFKKLDNLTPGIVAVTDGPNGVTVSDGKYLYKAGVFKEKAVVDRTGAGDAFGSGFVAGLMHAERPASSVRRSEKKELSANRYTLDAIRYAIRLASANATSVVEHIGATEGTLTKNQFEKQRRWSKFLIKIKKI